MVGDEWAEALGIIADGAGGEVPGAAVGEKPVDGGADGE
jgi:hypothetical protein